MDSVVRQRLVGTLVLVALGVVFWPIIFVEPRDQQPIELSPMPARPEIDTSPIASPESPEAKVRAQVAEPEFDELEQARADELTRLPEALGEVGLADLQAADAIEQVSSREQPPAAPALDASGYAQAWVLQVAAVSTKGQADALVARLIDKGYPAFSNRFQRDGVDRWRVQIGPKLEKAAFGDIKTEVDRVLDVDSMVVRYEQPS